VWWPRIRRSPLGGLFELSKGTGSESLTAANGSMLTLLSTEEAAAHGLLRWSWRTAQAGFGAEGDIHARRLRSRTPDGAGHGGPMPGGVDAAHQNLPFGSDGGRAGGS
jgi:hypothetical protein